MFLFAQSITDSDGGSAGRTVATTLSGLRLPQYFRLEQMLSEHQFSSDEEIEKNRRFRLICLRAQNEPEFRGLRMLPTYERYVRNDQFHAYEKRRIKDSLENETDAEQQQQQQQQRGTLDRTLEETNTLRMTPRTPRLKELENEIEASRARGQRLTRRIRDQIVKQFKFAQSQKTLADMVIEEEVPNMRYAMRNPYENAKLIYFLIYCCCCFVVRWPTCSTACMWSRSDRCIRRVASARSSRARTCRPTTSTFRSTWCTPTICPCAKRSSR